MIRSSRSEVFCKKGVLRNFAKFIGKRLCQSLFFDKVAGLRPATLLKKRLWHRRFPVTFAKFLRTPFLTEHLWWLLLYDLFSECLQCNIINNIPRGSSYGNSSAQRPKFSDRTNLKFHI